MFVSTAGIAYDTAVAFAYDTEQSRGGILGRAGSRRLRGRWGHALAPLVLSPADTAGYCFGFDLLPGRGQRKNCCDVLSARCVGLRLS